jgi:hypothetical protein
MRMLDRNKRSNLFRQTKKIHSIDAGVLDSIVFVVMLNKI